MVDANMAANTSGNWKGKERKSKLYYPCILQTLVHTIQRHLLLALIVTFEVGDATSQRSVTALDEATYQFQRWQAHSVTLARRFRNDILVKTLSKNIRVITATLHTLLKVKTCCRKIAIMMSCPVQRSAANTGDKYMCGCNARETTGLAMRARARTICSTGAGDDANIDGYWFIDLDLLAEFLGCQ